MPPRKQAGGAGPQSPSSSRSPKKTQSRKGKDATPARTTGDNDRTTGRGNAGPTAAGAAAPVSTSASQISPLNPANSWKFKLIFLIVPVSLRDAVVFGLVSVETTTNGVHCPCPCSYSSSNSSGTLRLPSDLSPQSGIGSPASSSSTPPPRRPRLPKTRIRGH